MYSKKLLVLFLILLASCSDRSIEWVSLRTDKDYDIVQYDLDRRIVWATNSYEEYIVAVAVDKNGTPVQDMSVINLPATEKSLGLCVNDSIWVVTGDKVLRYMPDTKVWDTNFKLDLHNVNYCKVLQDGSILFFDTKNQTDFLAKYRTGETISYIKLLPRWNDVAQDNEGNLWLATENEIYIRNLQNQNWMLWSNVTGADRIYFTRTALWIIKGQKLFYWKLTDEVSPREIKDVNFDWPPTVYQSSDGQIWIVSQKRIWRFDDGIIESVTIPAWVTHVNITTDFDPENNILFLSTEDGPYSVKLEK